MENNKPTRFGGKVATFLAGGDPSAAASYAQQPEAINQVIDATAQQLTKSKNVAASMQNQFVKNWLWPSLLQAPVNPIGTKPIPSANPLQGTPT